MKHLFSFAIITLLLLAAGCKKDSKILSKEYPYVIQEDVSEISETGITVKSVIISSGDYAIEDFGFVISEESKPVVTDRKISLKAVEASPDKITFRIDNALGKDQKYYIRAFIKTPGYLVYSNEKAFYSKGSIMPRIGHLSKTSAIPGDVVTIAGDYFNESPGNNVVRFGDVRARIIYEKRDTIIVQCPETKATKEVAVSVQTAGQTGYADAMFTLVNPWTPLADFPGGARFWSSSFTVGTKGYVALGMTNDGNYASRELWEFNSGTNLWQELPPFPGNARSNAIDFSIGNYGYIGLGVGNLVETYSDLWEYDPQANGWTKKADYPGATFNDHTYPHFVINNTLYLYSGFNQYEFWTYNPVQDQWRQLQSDAQMKNHNITEGFSAGNTGYFIEISGTGWDPKTLVLWQYDPLQNTIFKTDSVPLGSYWAEPCSFNIGRKLFISVRDRLLIEYDMDSKLAFTLAHPSDHEMFNFRMVFNSKAVLNNSETPVVNEFNSAAALHRK